MRPMRTRKELALASTTALAVALAAGAIAAHAQSFQASGTVVAGNATINVTPTSTAITVSSPSAVINWSPTDTAIGGGPIAFQSGSTFATFQNDPSFVADFAVLNRIVPVDPTRAVRFDGQVISQVVDPQFVGNRGGTLFFYSPGGILLGGNALFDVGNLALTASDLAYDPVTGAFDSAGSYAFQQANAGSRIDIAAGAQINAGTGNGYVALVAPAITQNGTISVSGSAALVAADAATITFRPSGLFDIEVTSGTGASGSVLANGGSIGGSAGDPASAHRAYLVAVPKNDAITMAIASGGALGFDIAAAADVVSNAVVLSVGYDVVNGAAAAVRSSGGGTGQADVAIGGIAATSAMAVKATGSASVSAGNGETAAFASTLDIAGTYNPLAAITDAALVRAQGTGEITVAGNLTVTSLPTTASVPSGSGGAILDVAGGSLSVGGDTVVSADRTAAAVGESAVGGLAQARFNGTVNLTGSILVSATAAGGEALSAGTSGGAGTGGRAELSFGGGTTSIGGALSVSADAVGGAARSPGIGGGAATGGVATLSGIAGGGTLSVGASVTISANVAGAAGTGCDACITDGGDGTGGTANFTLVGPDVHTVTIGGDLSLSTFGEGGASESNVTRGGNGTGGSIGFVASGAAHNVDVTGNSGIDAAARGGDAFGFGDAGNALGGTVTLSASAATLRFRQAVDIFANARGGESSPGGRAGSAYGGRVDVSATAGGAITFDAAFYASASATGGAAFSFTDGIGGEAEGGAISLTATGGTIEAAGEVDLFTTAYGGFGGQGGGAGLGGSVDVDVAGGGMLDVAAGFYLTSSGFGGDGDPAGTGTGGSVNLAIGAGGSAIFGSDSFVSMYATGNGGGTVLATGTGATGTGGSVSLSATGGSGTFDGSVYLSANGSSGSEGTTGNGGSGVGGQVGVSTGNGGTLGFAFLDLDATGSGAPGGSGDSDFTTGGAGGNGMGGTVTLAADGRGGAITVTELRASAIGYGGSGGSGDYNATGPGGDAGRGGAGTGGTIRIDTTAPADLAATSGVLSFGSVDLDASGLGGDGGFGGEGSSLGVGAAGGDGTGGTVEITMDEVGSRLVVSGLFVSEATGQGGDGHGCVSCLSDGGAGTGGQSRLFSGGGTISLAADALVTANGIGGAGSASRGVGIGGRGTGGAASIAAGTDTGLSGNGGSITLGGSVDILANGVGGDARLAGTGTGGTAALVTRNGSIAADSVNVVASGRGGNGQGGGTGGNGVGGTAVLIAESDAAGAGVITLDSAIVHALGEGGTGDRPFDAAVPGGTGGNGAGGAVRVAGSAGNGQLAIGDISATASGLGGTGGDGAFSEVDSGGNAGTGGRGIGGQVTVGTQSGADTGSLNQGFATFGTVTADATGFGGAGGAGGEGALGTGAGGTGGAAQAGGTTLLVRGSAVTLGGPGVFIASATGGQGGAGATDGAGGAANVGSTGGVSLVVSNRAGRPDQRGSLAAGDLSFSATATGGSGIVAGAASVGGAPILVDIRSADVAADNISFVASGVAGAGSAPPSTVFVSNGAITLGGSLAVVTPGDISLTLDNGDITATAALLSARNWVLGSQVPTGRRGNIAVTSGALFETDLDLVAYAGLSAPFPLTFNVPGNFRLDALSAAGDLDVVAGGSLSTGAITAQNVVLTAGGALSASSVSASRFTSVSGGATSAGRMTVSTAIDVRSGGLVSVGQQWSAPSIQIASTDLAIAPLAATSTVPAGLSAGTGGTITLVSRTNGQTLIGDGLTGTGYALSNAEWSLLSAGSVAVLAQDNASQATDMRIGTLAIRGPDAGASAGGTTGEVTFATGDLATLAPGGAIRIVGAVSATGFQGANALRFAGQRFELDAATGSLTVTGAGGGLSGTVEIDADGVHVASGSILDRLAVDPFYQGFAAELNAPAAVRRSEGVLRAGQFDLTIGRSLLVQNTGSALLPAGFVAVSGFTDVTPKSANPAASITMVVNGAFQTANGVVAGRDALDLVTATADNLEIFASGSQINGCSLVGAACAPTVDPVAAMSSQFAVLTAPGLGDTPPPAGNGSANEDGDDDDEQDGTGVLPPPVPMGAGSESDPAASPIAPPAPVIDSRPINAAVVIEEPVSGGGNPALIGLPRTGTNPQGEQQ